MKQEDVVKGIVYGSVLASLAGAVYTLASAPKPRGKTLKLQLLKAEVKRTVPPSYVFWFAVSEYVDGKQVETEPLNVYINGKKIKTLPKGSMKFPIRIPGDVPLPRSGTVAFRIKVCTDGICSNELRIERHERITPSPLTAPKEIRIRSFKVTNTVAVRLIGGKVVPMRLVEIYFDAFDQYGNRVELGKFTALKINNKIEWKPTKKNVCKLYLPSGTYHIRVCHGNPIYKTISVCSNEIVVTVPEMRATLSGIYFKDAWHDPYTAILFIYANYSVDGLTATRKVCAEAEGVKVYIDDKPYRYKGCQPVLAFPHPVEGTGSFRVKVCLDNKCYQKTLTVPH